MRDIDQQRAISLTVSSTASEVAIATYAAPRDVMVSADAFLASSSFIVAY